MGMFSSENVHTQVLTINSDPGSSPQNFPMMAAPRTITVVGTRAISKNAQNAGTALQFTLQNWGTAGTGVKSAAAAGTIAATLGGTATSARLAALTPALATLVTPLVLSGEWMTVVLATQGTGWISGDRFEYQIDYVIGD